MCCLHVLGQISFSCPQFPSLKFQEGNLPYVIPRGLMRQFCNKMSGVVPISFCYWHLSYCTSSIPFPPLSYNLFHVIVERLSCFFPPSDAEVDNWMRPGVRPPWSWWLFQVVHTTQASFCHLLAGILSELRWKISCWWFEGAGMWFGGHFKEWESQDLVMLVG